MQKRQLGSILLESGRITQGDVEQVLDYQRTHGGFFGQAIVALGILTREEIDWALASQFDLPFIFPNPEAVDREAAKLVPADWALAHLAVPIVRAGDTLTVVVADPLGSDTLEDLHARTGYEVEMALASASRIRELIRSIYGDGGPARLTDTTPINLSEFIADALSAGADRIGISVRGIAATGWYATRNARERRTLADGWASALDDTITPSPAEAVARSNGTAQKFDAAIRHNGGTVPVDAQVTSGGAGTEYLFRPTESATSRRPNTASLPQSVAAELRLLARVGNARVGVAMDRDDTTRSLTPLLPSLVLGDTVRAAHITAGDAVPDVYTLRADNSDEDFAATVEDLDFDALSIDLPTSDARIARIASAAPISFVFVEDPVDIDMIRNAGINWMLQITRSGDTASWELRPANR